MGSKCRPLEMLVPTLIEQVQPQGEPRAPAPLPGVHSAGLGRSPDGTRGHGQQLVPVTQIDRGC